MLPKALTLVNFAGHRLSKIDFSLFDSAVIIGKNRQNEYESNGTGKSTILHALDYVLFNYCNSENLDDLVREGCDFCEVTYDFDANNKDYRIIRKRNKKSSKSEVFLYIKNIDWENVSQRTSSEIEREIAKLIKISYKAWENTVLFSQNNLNGLATAKSPETRRAILKEALNITEYSKYEKAAKDELNELIKRLSDTKLLIANLGSPQIEIKTTEENLVQLSNQIIVVQNTLQLIEKEINETQESIKLLKEKITNTADLEQKLQTLKKKNEVLRTVGEKLTAQKSAEQSKLSSLNKNIENSTIQLRTLKAIEPSLTRKIEEVDADLQKLSTNQMNGEVLIGRLTQEHELLSVPFPDGKACPHCRQDVADEYKLSCIEHSAVKAGKILLQLEEFKIKLAGLKNKKKNLEEERKKINKAIGDQAKLEADIKAKNLEITHLNELFSATNDVNIKLNLDLSSKIDELNIGLKEEKLAFDEFKNAKNVDLLTNISNLQISLQTINYKKSDLTNELNSSLRMEGALKEKLNQKEKELAKLVELKEQLNKIEYDVRIAQYTVIGFGSSGMPAMIIRAVLDDLQIEANLILQQLRPRLELQIKVENDKEETLELIYRIYGKERKYSRFSGGEKLMIAIALKLGLSMVIQKRLGTEIRFIALDEVDKSLDKAGVTALIEIVRKLEKQFKILVVTHNDALQNKFKAVISVNHDPELGNTAELMC